MLSETDKQKALSHLKANYPEYYIAVVHHRNTHGNPMTFRDAPFWPPIYKDRANDRVIQSAVQTGKTEFCMISGFASAMEGLRVLYTLPSDKDAAKFVFDRIGPILSRVQFYRNSVGATDNVRIKKLWDGTVMYGGSNVITDFMGVPLNCLIFDEYDKCNQRNVIYAYDRLMAAFQRTGKMPRTLKIGNPTTAKYGINKSYIESTRQEWMIKCPSCGKWQNLDWFRNFLTQTDDNKYKPISREVDGIDAPLHNTGGVEMLCRYCYKPIDRHGQGEWVAEFPDRPISGYHISQLMTNQRTLDDIYIDWEESQYDQTKKQRFYNSILGVPYSGEGEQLTIDDLGRCAEDKYLMPMSANNCFSGIDVGGQLHVRIDRIENDKRRSAFIGRVPTFEELERLLRRFGHPTFVMDSRPEIHKAKEFVKKYPTGNGWLCDFYPGDKVSLYAIDRKERLIKANRTAVLDDATAVYLDGRAILPANWRDLDDGEFVRQMLAPVRRLDEDRTPPAYIWDEGGQPDHHRFADCYCNLACRLGGFGETAKGILWLD